MLKRINTQLGSRTADTEKHGGCIAPEQSGALLHGLKAVVSALGTLL